MKRTIGNKLNDYKHLKPPGSEYLPRLVMIRRATNLVFRKNVIAWLVLKEVFVQRMRGKHPEVVEKWTSDTKSKEEYWKQAKKKHRKDKKRR